MEKIKEEAKPLSTKERVAQIKEARNEEERSYVDTITVGTMKEAGLSPIDLLVDIKKMKPEFKDIPIDLSWEKLIRLHNAALRTGPEITDDTPWVDALIAIGKMLEKGFLLKASKNT